jgi:hypothetical protein
MEAGREMKLIRRFALANFVGYRDMVIPCVSWGVKSLKRPHSDTVNMMKLPLYPRCGSATVETLFLLRSTCMN